MNILVLGSEGQIGKPFCNYAEKNGHKIIPFDKKINDTQDLSTPDGYDLLGKVIKDCDVVLFLAFEVGGSKFLEKTDKTLAYISENTRLMDNCFRQLGKHKKPFLFASSQMANMHHTNYGFLKDLGERYTRSLNGYICRFWNVYGYEDPKSPKSHVITDFIEMAKSGLIEMRTTGDENRQFLFVDDCSEALLQWCINYSSISKDEYLDITSFNWNTIYEVAQIISKKFNCKIKRGEKSDTIQNGIMNTPSQYFKNFWIPKISLEEGISKLL